MLTFVLPYSLEFDDVVAAKPDMLAEVISLRNADEDPDTVPDHQLELVSHIVTTFEVSQISAKYGEAGLWFVQAEQASAMTSAC